MLLSSTNPTAAQLGRPAGDRRVWFRLVTPEVDTAGTITLPMGVDLTRFRLRPVFLWHHPLPGLQPEKDLPPPPPEAVIGRVVEIEQSEQALDILVEFVPGEVNPQAEICYQMILGGYLGAVSWGGNILRKEDRDIGGAVVPVITAVDLFEASLVIVGANPGAQMLERAIRALSLQPAPSPSSAATDPAPRTSSAAPARSEPVATKEPETCMTKDALRGKIGAGEGDADSKSMRAAAYRYAMETSDSPEERAAVCKAMDEHFPEHEEPDGDEAKAEAAAGAGEPAKEEKAEPAEKAEDADEEEIGKMDEKAVRAALLFSRRLSKRGASAASVDSQLEGEVQKLIDAGQVENTPARRKEAMELHRAGALLPALRAAGVQPGTFTTGQRLRGGRVGTETEIATRSAGGPATPPRKTAPDDITTQAQKDADEGLRALRVAAGRN